MTRTRDFAELATAYDSGNPLGFRNRIINGDFRIWQRGTSFTPNPVIYGADRFASFKSGASAGDYARSTDVPSGQGFTYSASFNNADVRHAVELLVAGNAGEFVSGSTWTVSFWAKVSSGTASSEVGLGFADGTNAGNFGRWGADQAYSLTTNWQRFTRTFTVSNTPAGSNACVLLYFGAAVGQLITGVQLEAGSVATPFERRPYGTELALCQRYYYRIVQTTASSVQLGGAIATTATSLRFFGTFPVFMRGRPAAVETSGTASDYVSFFAGTERDLTSITFNALTNESTWYLTGAVASGLTAGWGGIVNIKSNANAYLGFSAEL